MFKDLTKKEVMSVEGGGGSATISRNDSGGGSSSSNPGRSNYCHTSCRPAVTITIGN